MMDFNSWFDEAIKNGMTPEAIAAAVTNTLNERQKKSNERQEVLNTAKKNLRNALDTDKYNTNTIIASAILASFDRHSNWGKKEAEVIAGGLKSILSSIDAIVELPFNTGDIAAIEKFLKNLGL